MTDRPFIPSRLRGAAGILAALCAASALAGCVPGQSGPTAASDRSPASLATICVRDAARATGTPAEQVKVLQSLSLPTEDVVTVAIPEQGRIRCARGLDGTVKGMVWASGGPPRSAEPDKAAGASSPAAG